MRSGLSLQITRHKAKLAIPELQLSNAQVEFNRVALLGGAFNCIYDLLKNVYDRCLCDPSIISHIRHVYALQCSILEHSRCPQHLSWQIIQVAWCLGLVFEHL